MPPCRCHHPRLLHHCAITVDCRSKMTWLSLSIIVPLFLLLLALLLNTQSLSNHAHFQRGVISVPGTRFVGAQ
jgi:hypothetical protein